MRTVAIFDLDHTLIAVDCSHEWVKYMCENNLVTDSQKFLATKEDFNQRYLRGEVDMVAFHRFMLSPLMSQSIQSLQKIYDQFAHQLVEKFVYPQAKQALTKHFELGHECLLISASLADLVEPIGRYLGFNKQNVIGTTTIKDGDCYTGEIKQPLSFAEGKIWHYQNWKEVHEHTFDKDYFYSDSINDAPLLHRVDKPICINPDAKLKAIAQQNKWEIQTWTQ